MRVTVVATCVANEVDLLAYLTDVLTHLDLTPERVYCEGKFVFAQWDTKTRKIIEPSPEWRRAVGIDD